MIDQIVIGKIEAKLKVKVKKLIRPYHYDYLYGYDCMSMRRDSLDRFSMATSRMLEVKI